MVLEGITRAKACARAARPPGRPGLLRLIARRPAPRHRPARSARATAPCCCSASAPRCAAPSSSASLSATSTRSPARACCSPSRRSKTDQHGRGQRVAVWANPAEPGFCPAAALDAWLGHRRTSPRPRLDRQLRLRDERPLFCAVTKAGRVTGKGLSDKAVARLVKQAAADAGLDPGAFPATRYAAACSPPAARTRPSSPT